MAAAERSGVTRVNTELRANVEKGGCPRMVMDEGEKAAGLPGAVAARLALKDRALDVAAEGITIADALQPDRPLIYINQGFERMTGYPVAEVMGRNCRFLQGPDTDATAVAEIRAALAECRPCVLEILNYRKDGTTFWNRLSITPVRDGHGAEIGRAHV